MNTLTLRGIFSFQSGLFIGRITSSMRAAYMEWTENCPLLWSNQMQRSGLFVICTLEVIYTSSFQSSILRPIKFLRKDTLRGTELMTCCTVSCFRRTIIKPGKALSKGGVPQPDIIPESYLFAIMNLERNPT